MSPRLSIAGFQAEFENASNATPIIKLASRRDNAAVATPLLSFAMQLDHATIVTAPGLSTQTLIPSFPERKNAHSITRARD
ncbi:hypothetical protein OKW45_003170 [Paraburkholderia sp. WSM4175]|uniref:hypothetical protein n=1 Tax=Paraburkholderia sp. WSM4175 TaxID=2991072 RepID=UPI003D1AB732